MNSLAELKEKVLGLSKSERIVLAQSLWESVEDDDLPGYTESELREELRQRLRDEPDGNWKTHEQMMAEARREFGCRKFHRNLVGVSSD
jgi:putative addiction module component (TIGR02574 family)